jgi:hypothetical protein
MQYKFSPHFLLSQGSFVPKLNASPLWMFGTATVSTVHNDNHVVLALFPRHSPFLSTTTVVPGRNHVHTWIVPELRRDSHREEGLPQTPESLRCNHFVTCSGLLQTLTTLAAD